MARLVHGGIGIAMLALLAGGCFLVAAGVIVLIDGRVLLGAAMLGAGVLVLLGGRWWARQDLSPE